MDVSYRRIKNREEIGFMGTHYRGYAKLYIAPTGNKADGTFGNGLVALLRGVRDLGSLNRASKEMHMAYSKAWKLMNRAEEHVGTPLITRDGARGSTLTDEGRRILNAFEVVSRDLDEYANRRLQEELAKR
jgi:molybdate transport system regulatory protein